MSNTTPTLSLSASIGPEETIQKFSQYVRERDVDKLVALYEPAAVFIPEPGTEVTGHDALRAAFNDMLAINPELEIRSTELHKTTDVAYVSNDWKLTGVAPDGTPIQKSGRSSVVLRRQPSGAWLIAIDRL